MPCPVWESNDANGKLLGRKEGAESDWTSGSRLGRRSGGGAKGTIFEVIIAIAAMRVEGETFTTSWESELVEKEAKENKGSEGERKWGLGEGPSCCRYWQWVWG